MKFTKEVKEKWLADLKSGNFKQGTGSLYKEETDSYCCIGVLSISMGIDKEKLRGPLSGDAFSMLLSTCGRPLASQLWHVNDKVKYDEKAPRDFSNVIPLIEALPTAD